MDVIKRVVALVLAFCAHLWPTFSLEDIAPRDLGNPTKNNYTQTQRLACSVWDMEIMDGVLYIGAGDFGANTGPTDIWGWDTAAQTWSVTATVGDESVARFCKTESALYAPGIDSTASSWKYGNYHALVGDQWTSVERLPGAVHNFDVIEFEGKFFFGIGTADGKTSPVLCSTDGQSDFYSVPFYKNGQPMLSGRQEYFRVYDFFFCDDRLYCLLFSYDKKGYTGTFCRYDGESFEYIAEADLSYAGWKQMPVLGKACIGDTQYFTTGTLYKTEDCINLISVEMPNEGVVTDVYAYPKGEGQLLYALSNIHNEDGTYTATIYLIDEAATAVASYTARAPAMSLVRYGMHFYIGLGGSKKAEDTGKVIQLNVFDRLCG